MTDVLALSTRIAERFGDVIEVAKVALGELTIQVKAEHLRDVCFALRDEAEFDFRQLIDICGVDYLHYGLDEWETTSATEDGFSRGVELRLVNEASDPIQSRFAVVYHFLSLSHNHRVRIKVFLSDPPVIHSIFDIWPAANWYEREAFDLFGIYFQGHPDLRRLLTDYGFVGHPFRKDFPLSGRVEVRYDAEQKRVIYEPVDIVKRVLEPKVIRHDNRYEGE